jgi:hypothetical protein
MAVIPVAQTPQSLDRGVADLIIQDTSPTEKVFNAGTRKPCEEPLRQYLCAQAFKKCGATVPVGTPAVVTNTVCKTRCENMAQACAVDPTHEGLYDCSKVTETNRDVQGTCPTRLSKPLALAIPQAMTVKPGNGNGWEVPNGLNKYSEMAVYAGDMLNFNHNGGHNVYRFPNKAAYDQCDFSGATMLSSANAYTYHVDVQSGELYFGCQVGNHCVTGNQRVIAKVMPGGTCTAGIIAQCATFNRVGCGAVGGGGTWNDCGVCKNGYDDQNGTCVVQQNNAGTPTPTGNNGNVGDDPFNSSGTPTPVGGSIDNGGGSSGASATTYSVVAAVATLVAAALF